MSGRPIAVKCMRLPIAADFAQDSRKTCPATTTVIILDGI